MPKFLFIKNSTPYGLMLNEIEKGDCEVSIKSLNSKSWNQIKGVHRLCSLLAIRFAETYGNPFDLEDAKLNVKLQFGYLRPATHRECLKEALHIKAKKQALGEKVTIKQFDSLIADLLAAKTEPKSFADATKEEMVELIGKIEELGVRMKWDEVKLESHEKKEMLEFYQSKQ